MLASLIAIMVGGGVGSALRWGISQRLNALFPLLPPRNARFKYNCRIHYWICYSFFYPTNIIFSGSEADGHHRAMWWFIDIFYFFRGGIFAFAKRRLHLGRY